MSDEMKVESVDADGVVHIMCHGGLDGFINPPESHNPFVALLGPNWATKRVLLDLSRTDFLGSSAMGWLISCYRLFKGAGGALVTHSANLRVRQSFKLLHIASVIAVADNLEAAQRMMAAIPASPKAVETPK